MGTYDVWLDDVPLNEGDTRGVDVFEGRGQVPARALVRVAVPGQVGTTGLTGPVAGANLSIGLWLCPAAGGTLEGRRAALEADLARVMGLLVHPGLRKIAWQPPGGVMRYGWGRLQSEVVPEIDTHGVAARVRLVFELESPFWRGDSVASPVNRLESWLPPQVEASTAPIFDGEVLVQVREGVASFELDTGTSRFGFGGLLAGDSLRINNKTLRVQHSRYGLCTHLASYSGATPRFLDFYPGRPVWSSQPGKVQWSLTAAPAWVI